MRTRMVPFDALRAAPAPRRAPGRGRHRQAGPAQARRRAGRTRPQRARAHDRAAGAHAAQRGRARPGIAGRSARSASKPEEGTIRIAVRREGSEVVLEVGDDGAGLNRAAIRKRGEERGLIRSRRGAGRRRPRRADPGAGLLHRRRQSAASPAAASAWTWSPAKSASSAARSTSSPKPGKGTDVHPAPAADARGHPGGVRARSARPRSPCRSPRCAAWAASPRDQLEQGRTRPTSYGGEDYALHDLGTAARPRAGARPKASCRCRCC